METNTKMVILNGKNYYLLKDKMKYLLFVKILHLSVFATQKLDFMSHEE